MVSETDVDWSEAMSVINLRLSHCRVVESIRLGVDERYGRSKEVLSLS